MPKLLITPDEIKSHTTVQLNVEPHTFEVHLPEAQERWLRPKLGGALYDELLAYELPAPDAAPTALSRLAAQVKPMLAGWAVVQAWPDLIVKITQAGIVMKTGGQNGTTSADAKLLGIALQAQKETAEWRTGELVRWLGRNKATYPTWVPPAPPTTAALPIGGVFLG